MRTFIPVSIATAAALVVAGGAVGYQILDKSVELSVDGTPTTVSTLRGTVGDLLEQEGIAVGPRDLVAPGPDTRLSEGSRVAVQYGRQVRVEVDGSEQTHWTTATSVGEALALLSIKAEGADVSTSRSAGIGRDGLAFSVATSKEIELDVAGEESTVESTAATVGDVLAELEVETDAEDKVSPAPETEVTDGSSITVVDVEVADVKKTSPVEHETTRRESAELDRGTTEVDTEGRDGVLTTVVSVTRENGEVVKKKEKSSDVTTEPVDEVVLVGTKDEPAPQPEPAQAPARSSSSDSGSASSGSESSETEGSDSSGSDSDDSSRSDSDDSSGSDSDDSGSSGSDSDDSGSNDTATDDSGSDDSDDASSEGSDEEEQTGGSGSSAGAWDALATCESGGNWSINSGNGYYGGLQFSPSTWKAHGGSGMPHENSKAEQIRIAEKVRANQGWGAWPSCSSKLGLR